MGGSERKRWLFALFTALFLSILLFLSIISGLTASPYSPVHSATSPNRGPQFPPSFGYYIYGGAGDKDQIFRLLLAVYHPRNRYVLHLAADAGGQEREWLAAAVMSVPAFRAFSNVDVIGKPLWLTSMGATNIAATLRAVSILLKLDGGWDWFISLSAQDYPLLTQDDEHRIIVLRLVCGLPVWSRA